MRILLFLLAAASVAVAQNDDGRNRLVFPPGAKEPLANATPTPATTPVQDASKILDLFFLALKNNQLDAAYDNLVKGTIIVDRKEDVAALKEKTAQALENYGPISGYEVINEQTVGSHLMRRTCISLNSDLPLRWRFYFYKPGSTWQLVDLRVDDGLVELFDSVTTKPNP